MRATLALAAETGTAGETSLAAVCGGGGQLQRGLPSAPGWVLVCARIEAAARAAAGSWQQRCYSSRPAAAAAHHRASINAGKMRSTRGWVVAHLTSSSLRKAVAAAA